MITDSQLKFQINCQVNIILNMTPSSLKATCLIFLISILNLCNGLLSPTSQIVLGGFTNSKNTTIEKMSYDSQLNIAFIVKTDEHYLIGTDGSTQQYILFYQVYTNSNQAGSLKSTQLTFNSGVPQYVLSMESCFNNINILFQNDPQSVLLIQILKSDLSTINTLTLKSSLQIEFLLSDKTRLIELTIPNYQVVLAFKNNMNIILIQKDATTITMWTSNITQAEVTSLTFSRPTGDQIFLGLQSSSTQLYCLKLSNTQIIASWSVHLSEASQLELASQDLILTDYIIHAAFTNSGDQTKLWVIRSITTTGDTIQASPRYWELTIGTSSISFVKYHHIKLISKNLLIIVAETKTGDQFAPAIISITFKNNGQVSAVSEQLPLILSGQLAGMFINADNDLILGGMLNNINQGIKAITAKISFIKELVDSLNTQIISSISLYKTYSGTLDLTQWAPQILTLEVDTTQYAVPIAFNGSLSSSIPQLGDFCIMDDAVPIVSPLLNLTYLINQFDQTPSTFILPDPSPCTYKLESLPADLVASNITQSFTSATQLSFYSNNAGLSGQKYDIFKYCKPLPSVDQPGGCQTYQKIGILNVKRPAIASTGSKNFTYLIGQGALMISIVAYNVSLPEFYGDTNFDILHSVDIVNLTSASLNPTTFIDDTKYINLTIETSDFMIEGAYAFTVKSNFRTFESTTYQLQELYFFNLVDNCTGGSVQSHAPASPPIFYDIGSGTTSLFPFQSWTYAPLNNCSLHAFYYETNDTSLATVDASNNIAINQQDPLKDGYYTMTLRGVLNSTDNQKTYANSSVDVKIRLVAAPSHTKISTKMLTSQMYIVGDPTISFEFEEYQCTDPLIKVRYELISEYDSAWFLIDSQKRSITIAQTRDNSRIGFYSLKVRGYFDLSIAQSYYAEENLVLIFKHTCVRNQILAPLDLPIVYYELTDAATSTKLPAWASNMSASLCGPLIYTATLSDGRPLPPLLHFDAKELVFTVYSSQNPQDERDYPVRLRATTEHFNPEISQTQASLTVRVNCTAKSLSAGKGISRQKVAIGAVAPMSVSFEAFQIYPKCVRNKETIKYRSRLVGGGELPEFVRFEERTRKFIVQGTDGQLPKVFRIEVIGNVGTVTNKFVWELLLDIQDNLSQTDMLSEIMALANIKLKPANLTVKVGHTVNWQSEAFKQYTQSKYKAMNLPKFITLEDQTLIIKPRQIDSDNKFMIILLVEELSQFDEKGNNLKIAQLLTVTVPFSIGSKKYQQLTAKISSISSTAKVTILFNQKLKPQTPAELKKCLQLLISDETKQIIRTRLAFDWDVISLDNDIKLIIQMKFDSPLKVSVEEYDYLTVNVIDTSKFQALDNITVLSATSLFKKIPRQMDNSPSSIYINQMTEQLIAGINSFLNSSSVTNFILAYSLNRIWGSVTSLQVLMALPTMNIVMPMNGQLIYQIINFNFQLQFIKFNLGDFNIFSFEQISQSRRILQTEEDAQVVQNKSKTFSKQMEDQDIF